VAYESVKIRDIVERAVDHAWSIPEFQRGFVWKTTQVRDLADSLFADYPIGALLVWNASTHVEERNVGDAKRPRWLVDGQQRATALSILFGRKPYWWSDGEEWNRTVRRYDIRFDVEAKEPPYFWVANAVIRRAKKTKYIPVRELMTLDVDKSQADRDRLQELAREVKTQGLCEGMDPMSVYSRLYEVVTIREHDVPVIMIDHELEDVVEIFARLNSRGTRVTEADIYLGIVAARSPRWVRETFLVYRSQLAESGFDITPNLLFRTLTAVGRKKVRFKEIPDSFWDHDHIKPAWEKTQSTWTSVVKDIRDYGIFSNDPLPTENALVTLISLRERWPAARLSPMLHWFLLASRFGRYSGSATTALEEDLRDVGDSKTLDEALERLLVRFDHTSPVTADEFLRDYGDTRFGRFMLYLLAYANKAIDWDDRHHRIGFEGAELLAGFRPQWHHVFPRKFLEGKVPDEKIDALANIAVIGPSINIRISAKDPMDYIHEYEIGPDRLNQQYIDPDVDHMSVDNFPAWLQRRAERLADAANAYLENLKGTPPA